MTTGKKNLPQTIYIYIVFQFALTAIILYLINSTLDNTGFFPSPAWDTIDYSFAIVLPAFPIVLIYRIARSRRGNYVPRSSPVEKPNILQMMVGLCVLWFALALIVRIAFGLGCARIWTEWTGQPWSQIVSAEKTDKTSSGAIRRYILHSRPMLYCLSTPELRQSDFSQLCIPSEQFKSLPQNFSMRVEGKQSWFGFVIERYSLPEPEKLLEPEKM
jgi:hypothetical protein